MSDVASAFRWLRLLLEQHEQEAAERRVAAVRAWDGVTVEQTSERLQRIEQIHQQVYDLERAWLKLNRPPAPPQQPPDAAPETPAEE
jgi:hypothetical protein